MIKNNPFLSSLYLIYRWLRFLIYCKYKWFSGWKKEIHCQQLRTILIVRKETRCHHICYSFQLTARVQHCLKFFCFHFQHVSKDIEELRRIAFDVDGDPNINTVRKSHNSAKDYRKLGFQVKWHRHFLSCMHQYHVVSILSVIK